MVTDYSAWQHVCQDTVQHLRKDRETEGGSELVDYTEFKNHLQSPESGVFIYLFYFFDKIQILIICEFFNPLGKSILTYPD